jgi:branched-chain amino acid transport system ATP-binding protein
LAPSDGALLALEHLCAGYGKKQVLESVDIHVNPGEAVALIGHNGAGKTTLLRVAFGLHTLWGGSVRVAGHDVGRQYDARDAVRMGLAMIPAERFVFPDLTVLDNLRLSARRLDGVKQARRLEWAYESFPVLRERGKQLAGTMSGGEQRMVSLAMALIGEPRLLLLDEPSLGLSPAIAEQLTTHVRELVTDGTAVLIVEQNVPAALAVASRVYVLRSGSVIHEGGAQELLAMGREHWWELF